MLFTEPNRTPYDLRFNLFGIPVRVHPLFWLVAAILGAGSDPDPIELLLWIGTVFVSILIHEMGHALAARALWLATVDHAATASAAWPRIVRRITATPRRF